MYKVSIIVPIYNVEKYLDRCVQSLRNQTLKDIEIILVDDESPDNCPKLCDEYARMDRRIKVVHKKNGGLGMACNSGLDVATGEFVAFCDSDDFVDLNCYEILYNEAKKNKSDAVFSGIKRIDQNGVVRPMSVPKKSKTYSGNEISLFSLGMIASPMCDKQERERQMSAKIVLYSKEVIDKYSIRFKSEREFVSEDLLFNLDFLQHSSSISEVPQAFYYYFVNNLSLSQTLRKDRFEKYLKLRDYLLSNYNIGNDPSEFRDRVNKMFIGYVRSAIQQIVHSSEPVKEKKLLLSTICSNDIWELISSQSPINLLPASKRLIYWMTKSNHPFLLNLTFSLRK